DGEIVIAIGNDQQFTRLCSIVQLDHLAKDKRFKTNPNRVKYRNELIPLLQRAFLTNTSSYWKAQFDQYKIPCGPIQHLENVYNDPQLNARDMFNQVEHPTAGLIEMIGSPLKLSRTPVTIRHYPPNKGEHNDQILNTGRDSDGF